MQSIAISVRNATIYANCSAPESRGLKWFPFQFSVSATQPLHNKPTRREPTQPSSSTFSAFFNRPSDWNRDVVEQDRVGNARLNR